MQTQASAKLVDILKVLSDTSRLAIFDLLMQGVQCNCEIGNNLKMPMNLISHHLKVLRNAGLVIAERDTTDARWIYYSINQDTLHSIRKQIDAFLDPKRIRPRLQDCGQRVVTKQLTGSTKS
jgi:ArsR family transcriptional regulator